MLDIVSLLPKKHKRTASGWLSFNAVCCQHVGERPDTRQRGGIRPEGNNWSYHCFNCGYTASFTLGRTLSFKARKLLSWLGVDSSTISVINLDSLKHKDLNTVAEERALRKITKIEFTDYELPKELRLLSSEDQQFVDYLNSRGLDYRAYPYMVSPDETGRQSNRIVIPYTYDGRIVGSSSRYLDDKKPKYINEQQPGYVFGVDLQQEHWTHAIVVEGVFDALSINGLAVLHNTINDKQAQLINSLQKEIIVVPDRDRAGVTIINRAVELGWSVSIPPWDPTIKDVNDAVLYYGLVGTLMSIMQHKESSKIKIEMAKKKLYV